MDLMMRRELRRKKRRQKRMRILLVIAIIAAVIFGMCMAFGGGGEEPAVAPMPTPEATPEVSAEPTPTPKPQTADEFIATMTLDKKLMQLFVLDIDTLTGVENTTLHGNTSKKVISENPIGGILYDGGNIESKPQFASMLSNLQTQYKEENGFPAFLGISEEGGELSPGAAGGLGTAQAAFSTFAEGENYEGAYTAGNAIGKYLAAAGINMNLAPNCTVLEGLDAETCSSLVISAGDGMSAAGVKPVYKAFPGRVVSGSTKEQMEVNEILPFTVAINSGAELLMVSTAAAPVITGDSTPCAFSKAAVTDYIRTNLNFDGVVITEALLNTSDDAAVMAIEAGCDLLLLPKDYSASIASLKSAIESGRLTEERINESVRRILRLKLGM
ncbi:MAG: glycoside hydrolase family 3 N-terminal domain-containing protein [Clostridia bacterium]|nr:glycoside hydrolase family 3 N-terminal domain-containing protein [Clostridia bacterium]